MPKWAGIIKAIGRRGRTSHRNLASLQSISYDYLEYWLHYFLEIYISKVDLKFFLEIDNTKVDHKQVNIFFPRTICVS